MKRTLLFLLLPSWVQAQVWTARVMDKSSDNQGNQVVSLHFSSDKGQTYDIDDRIPLGAPSTQLADFVTATINQLNAQSVAFSSAPAIGQPVLPTPAVIPTPDPNATIKSQFLTDYMLLRQMQTAISHNILSATDLTFTAQLAKVNSELAANSAILFPLIQTGP